MFILVLVAGLVLFVLASYVFWRVGQENGIGPRWRDSAVKIALIVLIVLGGWSGGASLVVLSIAVMIAS